MMANRPASVDSVMVISPSRACAYFPQMLRMRLLSLTPHPLFSIQDTLHALRIDPADTKLSPSRRDLAQRLAPALQCPAAGYSGLLLRVLDKVTVLAISAGPTGI
jgi:hypothetical protein